MANPYSPGFWSQQYQKLSSSRRTQVNQAADSLFRQRTGIHRALNLATDGAFVSQWMRIRDEVMAEQFQSGMAGSKKTGPGKVRALPMPAKYILPALLYNYDVNVAHMKPEHKQFLDSFVVPFLKIKSLEIFVWIGGFASRTGNEEDDTSLSEARARTVHSYLMHAASPGVSFLRDTGYGKHDQVSKDPAYAALWKSVASLEEDERDRAVIVWLHWQAPNSIPAPPTVTQQTFTVAEWAKIFDHYFKVAAAAYATNAFLHITADYAPSPLRIKGVRVPLHLKYSWTHSAPTPEEVNAALREDTINMIDDAVKQQKRNVARAEIEQQFDTWFKSQH